MKVRCVICGRQVEYGGNVFRPFCSERYKLIDLGNWIEEQYRVPGAEVTLSPDFGADKEKKNLQ